MTDLTDHDYLLTTRQVAKMVGLAPYTVAKYRMKGVGPKYLQLGRKTIRYKKSDVLAWVDQITGGNDE